MSATNDVYKRIQERIQDYQLTPQEISAIEKARGQLKTHALTGFFTGTIVGYALARRRHLSPFRTFILSSVALFMGSQIGMVTGSLAGIRTIQELPNPGKLMGVVHEVRSEILADRGYKRDNPTSSPRRMTPAEQERRQRERAEWKQQQPGDPGTGNGFTSDDAAKLGDREARLGMGSEFEKDDDLRRLPAQNIHTTTTTTSSSTSDADADTASATPAPAAPTTTWSQIRAAKLPNQNLTWSKIREQAASGAKPAPVGSATEDEYSNGTTISSSVSSSSFPEGRTEAVQELPRTREEQAGMAARKRVNQYGDPIE